jgi:serine/threonine protein phosphatase PrpC
MSEAIDVVASSGFLGEVLGSLNAVFASSWVFFVAAVLLVVLLSRSKKRDGFQNDPMRYTMTTPKVLCKDVMHPYGISEMQGKRPYMEDRHIVHGHRKSNQLFSFYGVFDGHGGSFCSQYCLEHMCDNVIQQKAFAEGDMVKAITDGFLLTDKHYLEKANALRRDDGTTAVLVVIPENDPHIYVGNAGDSRAILVKSGGKVTPLSFDHKPNRPDERKRIQNLGGEVIFWGVWRVQGVLAVSRALGDRMLKQFVTAAPEVTRYPTTDDDQFLLIASDGVWDTVTNEDAARIVDQAPDIQVRFERLSNLMRYCVSSDFLEFIAVGFL